MPPDDSVVAATYRIHRLDALAVRKWWQDPLVAKKADLHANHGIQQTLTSLLSIPIFVAFSYFKFGLSLAVFGGAMVWIGLLALLFSFFRKHRHHVISVEVRETGLILRAPFLERHVRWLDISDFFPTSTAHPNEFLLQCKNGEEFFLSKDLSDSQTLFALIHQNIEPPATSFELNYRLPDGLIDMTKLAACAVAVAVIYLAPSMFHPIDSVNNLLSLIFIVATIGFATVWCWLGLAKTPQLIRVGRMGVYMGTGKNAQTIPWDHVSEIRKLGGWLVIRTAGTWSIVPAEKQEPVVQELLQQQEKLMITTKPR